VEFLLKNALASALVLAFTILSTPRLKPQCERTNKEDDVGVTFCLRQVCSWELPQTGRSVGTPVSIVGQYWVIGIPLLIFGLGCSMACHRPYSPWPSLGAKGKLVQQPVEHMSPTVVLPNLLGKFCPATDIPVFSN
jgi:hypothetical protein